MFFFVYKAHL